VRLLYHPEAARPLPQPAARLDRAGSRSARGARRKELLLISQDTTFYGIDRGERGALARLLGALQQVDGIEWIRMLYLYPTTIGDDVLDAMAANDKVCRYVDLPLQHASDAGAEADEAAGHTRQLREAARPHPDAGPGCRAAYHRHRRVPR
jgi:ribosomal protein S12 methylthiotransferase